MEDFGDEGEASEEYDIGGPNAIKLPWNPCGCGVLCFWTGIRSLRLSQCGVLSLCPRRSRCALRC